MTDDNVIGPDDPRYMRIMQMFRNHFGPGAKGRSLPAPDGRTYLWDGGKQNPVFKVLGNTPQTIDNKYGSTTFGPTTPTGGVAPVLPDSEADIPAEPAPKKSRKKTED